MTEVTEETGAMPLEDAAAEMSRRMSGLRPGTLTAVRLSFEAAGDLMSSSASPATIWKQPTQSMASRTSEPETRRR